MGASCINRQQCGKNDHLSQFPAALCTRRSNCLHLGVTGDETWIHSTFPSESDQPLSGNTLAHPGSSGLK